MPQKSRVLIVDDDESIRLILAEALSLDGHEIAEAETGEQALQMLNSESFDLVLTDLMMPATDGMELLTIIKKLTPETRVIMITAFATIEGAVEAMRKGASDYIAKPFDAAQVRKVVRRTLEEAVFSRRVSLSSSRKTDKDLQPLIKSLSSPIRRDVVEYLQGAGDASFMQIVEGIGIEDHTKLSFHLRKLRNAGILIQDERKRYRLSPRGNRVADILRSLKEKAVE